MESARTTLATLRHVVQHQASVEMVRPLSNLQNPISPGAVVQLRDEAIGQRIRRQLRAAGWTILGADAVARAALHISDNPKAVAGQPAGFAGRILIGTTASEHHDAILPGPDIDIVALAAAWDPRETIAGARRLAAVFGDVAIRDALLKLRPQLVSALEDADAELAHRIAGVAGTFGFPAASAAWRALADGDASDRSSALREARRVIIAIDACC